MSCRASFEELVLEADGGLRWSRLENLMEESSKSVGYDASQLWLLAGTGLLRFIDASDSSIWLTYLLDPFGRSICFIHWPDPLV